MPRPPQFWLVLNTLLLFALLGTQSNKYSISIPFVSIEQVGAVDFLKQPTIAFVRLAEGIPIPGVTEVPIPVRFIFILLGPKTVDLYYHEVGRSIATLMSNDHFHKIAYKADDRRDLLSAINEFLDDSIVLPPGNWQRNDLLPFEELKAKSEWIRERKNKALQHKNKDK